MLIRNGTVFINGEFVKTDVSLNEKLICGFGDAPADGFTLDCEGLKVIPGLVDIHTHGRLGCSFNHPDEPGISLMIKDYAHCGVTTVLATVMTDSYDVMIDACVKLKELIKDGTGVCKGINLEGPFLSETKKGAHASEYLKSPSIELFEKLDKASGEKIRLVSMAPELDGAAEFVGSLKKTGFAADAGRDRIRVSIGHSACGYETAAAAFDLGADHVTHAFNAMEGMSARNPGIIPAALDKGAYIELICDGFHVSPPLLRMIFKAAPDRAVLISDSISPAGMPDGEYRSGEKSLIKKGCSITDSQGVIAGSAISLFEGLHRCITEFGIKEEAAVKAATYNAAASAGLEKQVGSIAAGLTADLVAVNSEYEVIHVVSGGRLLY